MSDKKIVIATPSLVENDAVSNDVLLQAFALSDVGYEVHIFAEKFDHFFATKVTPIEIVRQVIAEPSHLFILHHSIHWELGEQLFNRADCKIIFRYHNITPADFFAENIEIQREITLGRLQNIFYANSRKISLFLSDSQFNSQELIEVGANPEICRVLAPLNKSDDFRSVRPDPLVAGELKQDSRLKLLFVGRVSPNKGQLHLVKLLNRYVELYGPEVCLYFVGKLGPKSYSVEIEKFINEHRLGSVVKFVNNASFSALCAYFQGCDAFVMMSEHEGFGVPILEAQINQLPIVAYGVTAVPETAGPNQLVFDHLNLDQWCAAIRVLATRNEVRKFLIDQGNTNAQKFALNRLRNQFLDLVQGQLC